MLRFYRIADVHAGATVLTKRLERELSAGKRVLWLLSGGSNIAVEVAVLNLLPVSLQPRLTIMLSDERYGRFGHKDSNMQLLYDAGFDPGSATILPVLTPENLPLEATAERYEQTVERAFAEADIIIAQLGIGPDGHVAGILPNSPAVAAHSLVISYRTEQYQRITFTFDALKQCVVYAFVFGNGKREQLDILRDKDLPLAEQPAQILKQIPESYVYNDQIGGFQ